MEPIVLGLNYKTAPVAVRECFAFSEEQIRMALRHLREFDDIRECVILSTCNRSEIYAVVEEDADGEAALHELLAAIAPDVQDAEAHLYCHSGPDCISHLFRVSASLDSLVMGEGQILSQVKKAYAMARDCGATGTVLNTLFNRAIKVGKKVRSETRIAFSAVSVSYAAVEQARQVVGDLSSCRVLILGAGEMSELTARHLVANGVKAVFVSNRNYERAVEFADKFHGTAVPFDSYMRHAVDADIIITSTGAPHYIIRAWDVAHLMPKRQGRPLIIIDIAVPRDVEPETAAIAGVSLYNIDDLEEVVEANRRSRQEEAAAALEIIETEQAELVSKFRYLAFRPTLSLLTDKAERLRRHALKRAMAKLPDASPEERRVMENMSRLLVRKLLRDPLVSVNEAIGSEREEYYLEALSRLFKLEELGEDITNDNGKEKSCYRYARQ